MEKTVFLFRRHPSRDREDFGRYYIQKHAPLGVKLTRCLLGYTVNLVETEGGPGAITEHWVPEALDILTPEKAYATREDFEEVLHDDQNLFAGFELYVVDQEVEAAPGKPIEAPLGQPTPGTKLVWFIADPVTAPPPPTGALRVVDNRVRHKLVHDGNGAWKEIAPEFKLIRMAWTSDVDQIGPAASDALIVKEHCFIRAPAWEPATAG